MFSFTKYLNILICIFFSLLNYFLAFIPAVVGWDDQFAASNPALQYQVFPSPPSAHPQLFPVEVNGISLATVRLNWENSMEKISLYEELGLLFFLEKKN